MLIYSAVKRIFKHFNAQQIVRDKRLYASAHSRFERIVCYYKEHPEIDRRKE